MTVVLAGDWLLRGPLPDTQPLARRLRATPPPAFLTFDTAALGRWDSALLAVLVAIRRQADGAGIAVRQDDLPESTQRLLDLAFTVGEASGARRAPARWNVLERLGRWSLGALRNGNATVAFVGEVTLSLGRLLRGRATMLPAHVLQYLQEAGVEALPIVSLITFLIGMIFAFVGVMQLEPFGVGVYTADLVAIAMVREMAPIMTAILMAGRTAAAAAGLSRRK